MAKRRKAKSKLAASFTRRKKFLKKANAKRKKPLWDIKQGITFSGLSKYRECPEQFSLSYIEGLTPKKLSLPLEFGSLMHLCLEHQYTSDLTPRSVASQITKDYRKQRGKNLLHSGEKDTLEFILGLVNITFPRYCEYWKHDDKKITWLKREEKFSIHYNLPTPSGNTKVLFRGMRDGLYNRDGNNGVFETKTKSRIPNDQDINDQLKYDMQTMFYAFTSYLETGKMPTETLYNVIRRSQLYRRKEEPLATYLKRIKDDMDDKPDHYFKRWVIHFTQEDVLNFVNKTLHPLVNDFVRWYSTIKKNPLDRFQSPYHFLDFNALFGKYGKSLMFDAVQGNRRPYFTRTVAFPELEESFQPDLLT